MPPLVATRREEVFSMTDNEKRTILDMRAAGKQYKEMKLPVRKSQSVRMFIDFSINSW